MSNKLTTTEFIKRYKDIAIKEMVRTGVPASITLAQAAVESGWGGSGLSVQANNYFGIKADISWSGAVYNADTREVFDGKDVYIKSDFRKYDSVEESFKDHSDFLVDNRRYNSLFASMDWRLWTVGLQKAGYATSTKYASTLENIIKAYNLEQFDEIGKKKGKTGPEQINIDCSPGDNIIININLATK